MPRKKNEPPSQYGPYPGYTAIKATYLKQPADFTTEHGVTSYTEYDGWHLLAVVHDDVLLRELSQQPFRYDVGGGATGSKGSAATPFHVASKVVLVFGVPEDRHVRQLVDYTTALELSKEQLQRQLASSRAETEALRTEAGELKRKVEELLLRLGIADLAPNV